MAQYVRCKRPRPLRQPRLRAGDLVTLRGSHRRHVVLPVTLADLRRGMNARSPGLHLFGGYWYAREAMGGPLNHKAYGKIDWVEPGQMIRVVGRAVGHFAVNRHCR